MYLQIHEIHRTSTYRFGQWTCRPDLVCRTGRAVVSERNADFLAGGAAVAAGGLGALGGLTIGVASARSSTCATFNRSTLTWSRFPPICKVKNFSFRFRTLNGPLYGCCNGLRTVSSRTKTCELWNKSLGTYVAPCLARVGVSVHALICRLKRET